MLSSGDRRRRIQIPCCGRSSSTLICCGSCKFFVAVVHLLASSSSCSHCCNSWIYLIRFETSIHPCTGCTLVNLKRAPHSRHTDLSGMVVWELTLKSSPKISSLRDALLLISNRFPAHHTPSSSWVFPFDAYILHTFHIPHTLVAGEAQGTFRVFN